MSSFVYNFENLDDIIADKNCKFRIKQILNEVNNRDFESGSPEYLEKQKSCFLSIMLFPKESLIHLMIKLLILKKMNF